MEGSKYRNKTSFATIFAILTMLQTFDVSCGAKKTPAQNPDYKLLLISFDGFRWNYLQRTNTPNFDKFIKGGVHAKYGIKDAFVTKTFPNHFTLVTGLWEESHGIINNEMYDPVLNESFSPPNTKSQTSPEWYSVGAEPIWVTNQLQKLQGRSGVHMWVGGGAPIKWVQPSRYIPFSSSVQDHDKVDTLVKWFTDEYPINLGLMYFMQPDYDGHEFGPESKEVTKRIGQLDEVVGYLLAQLEAKDLLKDMNIIITSDHGFSSTPKQNAINLNDFIDSSSYTLTGLTPIANIWPHEGKMEEIFQNLTKGATKNHNFTVYRREDVPSHFHYSKNRRIPPILAVAKDHFVFVTNEHPEPYNLGNHGYDNRNQNMHPFFLAMGPSFKKGYSIDTFNSVDVYPLMCQLLQVIPAPNNGSMDVVKMLLVDLNDSKTSVTTFVTYIVGGVLVACVASVFMFGVFRYRRYLSSVKRYRYSSLGNQESAISETMNNAAPLLLDN
ncbi:ectonucleotide pyrophosphatase/phosphodiesterase family member 5 [Elysia marginata]|uniref:Ectonucleotide pyrophosphatase/phosphodiesterase family member 5 n=1 Tax=Elysia marginata TaxID=1093978 RepID=A0AAV4EB60_9GAST|nr:ectonucleotide pyrophosphatase/phosphodiesterase family member 5 [Elysia marginata]